MTDEVAAVLGPDHVERVHEDGGSVLWLHLPGHVNLDDATAIFWAHLADWLDNSPYGLARGGPYHTWLRKVPWRKEDDGGWDGSFRYVYTRPGRGATPITVAEVGSLARPPRRCGNWPRCHRPGSFAWYGEPYYCRRCRQPAPWERPRTTHVTDRREAPPVVADPR
jgi:hypothetical protein